MIDVFAALARPVKSPCPPGYKMDPRRDKCVPAHQKLGDAPPAPTPTNWTGIPEPPGWKELTGGMSWPPTGAFPPSPPPACALAPGLWPCSPWPPPPPVGWPAGWPWPLPFGPAPGAPPPPPPPVAPAPPPATTVTPEKAFPWGWVVFGGLALGAGLLLVGGAGALAANPVSESNVEHYRLAAEANIKADKAIARAKKLRGAARTAALDEAEALVRSAVEHSRAAGERWITYEHSSGREEIERLRGRA